PHDHDRRQGCPHARGRARAVRARQVEERGPPRDRAGRDLRESGAGAERRAADRAGRLARRSQPAVAQRQEGLRAHPGRRLTMFIGHYALGFAAKRVAPRTSLGTLFAAPTLADLLWPVFLLLGLEHAHVVPGPNPFLTLWLDDYPYSHSLFALIVWGALFGYLY